MHIRTNKEVLTQSGSARRASRLQRSSITSSRCQDEVIAAGGCRNRVISKTVRGFLGLLRRARLFGVHTVQGLIAIPHVEKHVDLDALRNGASALAKLGSIKTGRPTLAKVLQLIQINAWIPGEPKFQGLLSTGSGHGLLLDVNSVGCKRDPLEKRLDLIRHHSSWPQGFKDRNNGFAEFRAQFRNWMKLAFNQRDQLSQGKLGLGVIARDDLLFCPVLP
jgi:hypothetical protein